jgi:hypothetical protein
MSILNAQKRIFIGFYPNELNEEALIDLLCQRLQVHPSTAFSVHTGRRLFTNHKIIEFTQPPPEALFKTLTTDPQQIEGKEVYIVEYEGPVTYEAIEKKYADLAVFITGIPLSKKFDFLFQILNEISPLTDLYIPKKGKKKNKHFGFANFASMKDKEAFLAQGKLKHSKFRLVFRNFSLVDLTRLNKEVQLKIQKMEQEKRTANNKDTGTLLPVENRGGELRVSGSFHNANRALLPKTETLNKGNAGVHELEQNQGTQQSHSFGMKDNRRNLIPPVWNRKPDKMFQNEINWRRGMLSNNHQPPNLRLNKPSTGNGPRISYSRCNGNQMYNSPFNGMNSLRNNFGYGIETLDQGF